MAFSLPAMADSWALNIWGGSNGPPPLPLPWATVTATDMGDFLDVSVALQNATVSFVDTGTHHAFTFNVTGIAGVTVDTLNWGTASTGSFSNPSFQGPFNWAIDNDSGGNNAHAGPLTFHINATGISIANLGVNPIFAADVLFPEGLTGTIGNGTLAVPEPETYAMMLVGFGLLGFVARRRKGRLGNVATA